MIAQKAPCVFMQRTTAAACAALLLLAPMAHTQEDDMPDGDVDLVEKPRPPKKAEPPKESPKKKRERKSEPTDDDVLSREQSGVKIAPRVDAPPVVADDAEDDAEDDAGASRLVVPVKADTDADVPARPQQPTPLKDKVFEVVKDSEPEEARLPVLTPADDGEDFIEIAPSPALPSDPDEAGSTWLVVGAAAGGLVLLAGAGVGGYFLVEALVPATGSVVVTPR